MTEGLHVGEDLLGFGAARLAGVSEILLDFLKVEEKAEGMVEFRVSRTLAVLAACFKEFWESELEAAGCF